MVWNKRIPTDFVCTHCQKIFTKLVSKSTRLPKRAYCGNECRLSDKSSFVSEWTEERRLEYSVKFSGENNPNYNNRWTEERKLEFSERIKKICENNPELRYSYGNANRGKKFSQERIDAMHKHRDPMSYGTRCHTEETKKLIGQKSSSKWTPEYKEKHKKTMIERGFWKESSDDYEDFYQKANWIERMIDYATPEELALIESFGLFSHRNTSGYVRDHIVSRGIGYEFGIPYYILRHPENCQFITHSENIKKGFLERKLDESVKIQLIQDLLTRIETTKIEWVEQDACIAYIMQRKEVV